MGESTVEKRGMDGHTRLSWIVEAPVDAVSPGMGFGQDGQKSKGCCQSEEGLECHYGDCDGIMNVYEDRKGGMEG